jgi:hypothetical protein
MYASLSAAAAEEHRRHLLAEASHARLAREARAARPRVRRQRRFAHWTLQPLFDLSDLRRAGARTA